MALTQISTNGIKNANVNTADLADGAVNGSKIANNAVGLNALADGAVDTAAIVNGAVTAAKIANGVITQQLLASGTGDLSHDTSPQLGGDLASNGSDINFADDDKAIFGASSDLQIFHNANGNSQIKYANGNLAIKQGSHSDSQCLQFDGNGHLYVPDNEKIYFGASADLQIYHDGSNSILNEGGTGHLQFQVSGTTKAAIVADGVQLYEHLYVQDSDRIKVGDGSDLQIYHDGSNSRIENTTGSLVLGTTAQTSYKANTHQFETADGTETVATFNANADVQLRHNNAIKLYTNASGVNVDKCIQAGSVQSPIERDITHHQSFDPAGLFYPEGAYGNNNSPSNQRQAVIIGATKGNWLEGNSSSNHRSLGLKISRIINSAEQIRAGIQHDINSSEKFKFWTSYGDIHFRTRNDNNGNKTWEECDKDPLIMHHNGHVSMMHMPRILLSMGGDNNSYSSDMTLHTVTGSATTHGGMTYSNGTITVPYQGVYQICANVGVHTNSANTQRLDLLINNSNWQRTEYAGASGWQTHYITHAIELAANNTISFKVAGKWDASPFSRISVCMLHGTLTT